MTFGKLASAGDVTLKVNGPIDASALVTAGTLTLDDSYISKVTSINLDALTTVTEIQTDSGGTDNIVFTSATDVQLGALASYPGAGSDYGLTITTKADATLDIGSLDDVKTDGTAAAVSLTLNGPKDVTISNMTAYAGSLSLTNIENATITGFKGAITVNGGVENITMTDVEDFAFSSATGLKTDENNRCPFEGCDWINKSGKKTTEQMHFSRLHPVECGYKHLTYSCAICKSNFRSRSDINQHHKN